MIVMNAKVRFYLLAAGVGLVVLALVVVGYMFLDTDDVFESVLSFSIALVVAIIGLIFLKRRYDDLKTGQPMVDERTRKVEVTAGYYSYLISLYMWLAIMFVNDSEANTLIARGMVGMALIFVASWVVLNWKERFGW